MFFGDKVYVSEDTAKSLKGTLVVEIESYLDRAIEVLRMRYDRKPLGLRFHKTLDCYRRTRSVSGENTVLKTLFWGFTLAGLAAPNFLAFLAWQWSIGQSNLEAAGRPPTPDQFTLIHTWQIQLRLGPLSIRYFPHIWAAVLIVIGSAFVICGMLWILQVPKTATPGN
jgi:hypothetical protein